MTAQGYKYLSPPSAHTVGILLFTRRISTSLSRIAIHKGLSARCDSTRASRTSVYIQPLAKQRFYLALPSPRAVIVKIAARYLLRVVAVGQSESSELSQTPRKLLSFYRTEDRFWPDFANIKHDYTEEFYRSYSSFISQCPRTGKFRAVCCHTTDHGKTAHVLGDTDVLIRSQPSLQDRSQDHNRVSDNLNSTMQ